jgi:RND family efflux transporter MFP subunit
MNPTQQPESGGLDDEKAAKLRRLTSVGLLIVLLLVAVLVGVRLYTRLQPVAVSPVPPLVVETRTLAPQSFVQRLHTTGTLEAEHRVVLSAQLAARIDDLPWREGARVEQGDILVQLDESEARQEVARLQATADRVTADLGFWRQQLETDRRLLKTDSISRRSFDETQRQVSTLEAALRETRQSLQSARIRLEYARVRAPFDAYVQTVYRLPGEFVQPGTALLEIIAADPLKAVVSVAEGDVSALQRGGRAQIRVPAAGMSWPGKVDRIYPALERVTRSATVELFLPPGLAAVRPGMAVTVDFELSRSDQAIVIPRQALRERAGESGAFVLADGMASWRSVLPGPAQDDGLRILAGLNAGDELIITPHPQLADRRPVTARNDWRSGNP